MYTAVTIRGARSQAPAAPNGESDKISSRRQEEEDGDEAGEGAAEPCELRDGHLLACVRVRVD